MSRIEYEIYGNINPETLFHQGSVKEVFPIAVIEHGTVHSETISQFPVSEILKTFLHPNGAQVPSLRTVVERRHLAANCPRFMKPKLILFGIKRKIYGFRR